MGKGDSTVPRLSESRKTGNANDATIESFQSDSMLTKQDMALELIRQRHINEELAARIEALKSSNEVMLALNQSETEGIG